jgi:hypothetical protein
LFRFSARGRIRGMNPEKSSTLVALCGETWSAVLVSAAHQRLDDP